MSAVESGKVVIFGAGGPVGAAAIASLKQEYVIRCTDATAIEEIVAEERRQSQRAPLPELLSAPHENRVVDVTDYDQVRAACEGMDAAINLTVVRPHYEKAFTVNLVGAYNVAKACVETGVCRLIHTGPFHTALGHNADYWHDHGLVDDIPLHPGDDLYALTKYLGGEVTRVFAEEHDLDVVTYLYCGFRPREILPEERGQGVHPFLVSWEDTGEAFVNGLRVPDTPNAYEVFFIAAPTPDGKHSFAKAKRLLGWEATDTWEELYKRPS
ncbi:MAG: NAD-dependent epimerase/dehydratase family protein [Candidatus Latescibacterota bacterium]|nr:NAD-dependent epimerase/dehydratase family protein [Candidatus Latescibacterota bacterium]